MGDFRMCLKRGMCVLVYFDHMRIAITGGIGCGKSTVAKIFEKAGFLNIDTDRYAHELLGDDVVKSGIRGHFGDGVFDGNVVNRQRLGAEAFASEENLRYLEDLLHPSVIARYRQGLEEAEGEDIVVQIPLLYEKKLEKDFEYVICVVCNDLVSLDRLRKRNIRPEDAEQRSRFQLPLEEKANRADFVITNNTTLEDLEESVSLIIKKIKSHA